MSTAQQPRPKFRVGDRVRIPWGVRKVPGVVIEDRGAIGVGGRRLFRVQIPMDPFEPHEVEMAEEEIEHLPETAPPRLDKAKIIEYLKYGGLISILRSGLGGAPARAWLCPDTLGNVTHTFAAERGVVGGEPIPMAAVFESRVSKPKQEGVASYLRSFGLDQREARQVVAFIGTAP